MRVNADRHTDRLRDRQTDRLRVRKTYCLTDDRFSHRLTDRPIQQTVRLNRQTDYLAD